MLEETRYLALADAAFKRIERAFADVDADDADLERAGDVVTILFRGGKKCIVNTQRPTRQVWVAANARAWHFSYDEAKDAWYDDKDPATELYATIAAIVREASGVALAI